MGDQRPQRVDEGRRQALDGGAVMAMAAVRPHQLETAVADAAVDVQEMRRRRPRRLWLGPVDSSARASPGSAGSARSSWPEIVEADLAAPPAQISPQPPRRRAGSAGDRTRCPVAGMARSCSLTAFRASPGPVRPRSSSRTGNRLVNQPTVRDRSTSSNSSSRPCPSRSSSSSSRPAPLPEGLRQRRQQHVVDLRAVRGGHLVQQPPRLLRAQRRHHAVRRRHVVDPPRVVHRER